MDRPSECRYGVDTASFIPLAKRTDVDDCTKCPDELERGSRIPFPKGTNLNSPG